MNEPLLKGLIYLGMAAVAVAAVIGGGIALGQYIEPNTVVTFCEWVQGSEFADCIKTEYWHNDNYQVIKELTTQYRAPVNDL